MTACLATGSKTGRKHHAFQMSLPLNVLACRFGPHARLAGSPGAATAQATRCNPSGHVSLSEAAVTRDGFQEILRTFLQPGAFRLSYYLDPGSKPSSTHAFADAVDTRERSLDTCSAPSCVPDASKTRAAPLATRRLDPR